LIEKFFGWGQSRFQIGGLILMIYYVPLYNLGVDYYWSITLRLCTCYLNASCSYYFLV
jgi:hypothetical protein